MNVTTATPVEIDTALAEIMNKQSLLTMRVTSIIESLHRAAGDEKARVGNGWRSEYRWGMGLDEAILAAQTATKSEQSWVARKATDALAEWDEAQAEATSLKEQAAPLNAEFVRRGGWTRAFLAASANGHIHSSRECSTCYPTTQFFWFTDLSGADEAEIVTKAGSDACTVCYPSAPVNDLKRPRSIFSEDEKAAQQAREQRAAEKSAREAKKIEKALSMDGSEVTVTYGEGRYDRETFKTAQAARTWVLQHAADWGMKHTDSAGWMKASATIVGMLAEKEGRDVSDVLFDIQKRALAKAKRDGGYTSPEQVLAAMAEIQKNL